MLSMQPSVGPSQARSCLNVCSVALCWTHVPKVPLGVRGGGQAPPQRTCHEKLSSTSRLSRSIGGSQGESPTVGLGHGGDRQFSAAIAKGDLHAGKSGRGNCLAIPKPAHLRNWETCSEDSSPVMLGWAPPCPNR